MARMARTSKGMSKRAPLALEKLIYAWLCLARMMIMGALMG